MFVPYEPKMLAISLRKNLGFNTVWQGSMIYYTALACHVFSPDPSIERMILRR